jgi:hypothetical protein
LKLIRTLFFAILAAALAPMPAVGQLNQEGAPPPEQSATYKYEVYVGAAYSRIRQVPESYSGLVGGKVSVGRDWGKYFQLAGSGDYYTVGTGHSELPTPGHPTMYTFMVAPTVHATLYENLSGEFFGEVGGEHTGGESMTPSISFAGGFGGGLTYNLFQRLAVQLTGDRVAASFSLPGNTPQLGYATHRTWNVRGTLGVVYRF